MSADKDSEPDLVAPDTPKTAEQLAHDTGLPEHEQLDRDTSYSPSSEDDMEPLQRHPRQSEALDDPDIDPDDVQVLPGAGGPDDQGDVDVDPRDIHIPGRATPD
jgi:hypothetical protein